MAKKVKIAKEKKKKKKGNKNKIINKNIQASTVNNHSVTCHQLKENEKTLNNRKIHLPLFYHHTSLILVLINTSEKVYLQRYHKNIEINMIHQNSICAN